MHELSLLVSLRELALEQARLQQARRIEVIHLRIGSLAGVEPQALHFAFAVVMADSPAAAARLQIETVPARSFCDHCRAAFANAQGLCLCPRCGSASTRLLQGRELELAALEIS